MNFVLHPDGFWGKEFKSGESPSFSLCLMSRHDEILFEMERRVWLRWKDKLISMNNIVRSSTNYNYPCVSGGRIYCNYQIQYSESPHQCGMIRDGKFVEMNEGWCHFIPTHDKDSVITVDRDNLVLWSGGKFVGRAGMTRGIFGGYVFYQSDYRDGMLVFADSQLGGLYAGSLAFSKKSITVESRHNFEQHGRQISFRGVNFIGSRRVAIAQECLGEKESFRVEVFDLAEDGSPSYLWDTRHEGEIVNILSPRDNGLLILTRDSFIQLSGREEKTYVFPREMGVCLAMCLSEDRLVATVLTNLGMIKIDLE